MFRGTTKSIAVAGLALAALAASPALAQEKMQDSGMQKDAMKQDAMHDSMKHDDAMVDKSAKPVLTGTFHGKVHETSGRATIYQQADGKKILRLTNFKTSNGPDVHVILIAAKDAADNDNFSSSKIEHIELGKLKGNEGDQNYELPANADLSKFQIVSIYCERFNANFGAASLTKF
jgi:pentapeptide MXKDX repeat protein